MLSALGVITMSVNKNKRLNIPNTLKITAKSRLKTVKKPSYFNVEDEAEKFIRTKIDVRIVPPALTQEISEAKHLRQHLRDTLIKLLKASQLKTGLNKFKIPYRNDAESLSDYYRRLNSKFEAVLTPVKPKGKLSTKNTQKKTALIIDLKKALAKHKRNTMQEKSTLIQRVVTPLKSNTVGSSINAIKERILSNIMYHIHTPFSGDKAGQKAYNHLRESIRRSMLEVELTHEDWIRRERVFSVIDIQLLPQKEQETNHQYYDRLKHHLPNALNKLKNPTSMLDVQQRELKAQKTTLLKEIETLLDLIKEQQRRIKKSSKANNIDWEPYLEKLKSLQAISNALDTPIAKLGELRGNVRGIMHEIMGFQKRIGKIKASLVMFIPSLIIKKPKPVLKPNAKNIKRPLNKKR